MLSCMNTEGARVLLPNDGQKWLPIDGFNGRYYISESGSIWKTETRCRRTCDRNDRTIPAMLLSGRKCSRGYIKYHLNDGSGSRPYAGHRLVADAFCEGRTPERNHVNHKDGNPSNNHFSNLEWCTPRENALHKRDVLRSGVGESSPLAVLTTSQVESILVDNRTRRDIARHYGVSVCTIRSIKTRETWKHIDVEPVKSDSRIKLNMEIARQIRADTGTQNELGKKYGVAGPTICLIRKNKIWVE